MALQGWKTRQGVWGVDGKQGEEPVPVLAGKNSLQGGSDPEGGSQVSVPSGVPEKVMP